MITQPQDFFFADFLSASSALNLSRFLSIREMNSSCLSRCSVVVQLYALESHHELKPRFSGWSLRSSSSNWSGTAAILLWYSTTIDNGWSLKWLPIQFWSSRTVAFCLAPEKELSALVCPVPFFLRDWPATIKNDRLTHEWILGYIDREVPVRVWGISTRLQNDPFPIRLHA